ncbi:ArgE/DapE family deacylase [Candidatus Micrarchaeota archaeon]|nr:ArgE/DapE family deacylase [Candidatus Micrarchaeota archaeon]
MANNASEVSGLLKELVSKPSTSRDEKKISEFIYKYLTSKGLNPKKQGLNVYCEIGDGKKTLLLNSHMDTVPACNGWESDPFKALEKEDKVYGLGANDAKGSLAAMISAMVGLKNCKLNGKVIFAASVEEEVSNSGIVELMDKIGKVDGAIIGEPTAGKICTAMRGMLILKFKAKGKSCHASRPEQGINAIYKAIEDVNKLKEMKFEESHPLVGKPTISVTMINAGTKNNIVPDQCEFTANIRTTPLIPNNEVLARIKKTVNSEIEIYSNRFYPKETDEKAGLIHAAKKAIPNAEIGGMLGTCDFAFVDAPGIIYGPGNPKQSHGANEFVKINEVEKAVENYKKIVLEFLA